VDDPLPGHEGERPRKTGDAETVLEIMVKGHPKKLTLRELIPGEGDEAELSRKYKAVGDVISFFFGGRGKNKGLDRALPVRWWKGVMALAIWFGGGSQKRSAEAFHCRCRDHYRHRHRCHYPDITSTLYD
jgi:hypothetical protein